MTFPAVSQDNPSAEHNTAFHNLYFGISERQLKCLQVGWHTMKLNALGKHGARAREKKITKKKNTNYWMGCMTRFIKGYRSRISWIHLFESHHNRNFRSQVWVSQSFVAKAQTCKEAFKTTHIKDAQKLNIEQNKPTSC